jgi:hypothetical protein
MEPTKTTEPTDAPAATGAQTLDAIASQLLDLVTQMESLVPDFEPHDKREIARVAAGAKFAHELIAATVTMVTSVPSVPQDLFNVAAAQEALRVRDQLRPIAQRLAAFAQGLEFTINTKLSASGEDSLQSYHWVKRAVKGPNGAALQPYADEMRRVVKRAINRSKKPKTEPPTPSPAPQGQSFMAIMPQRPAEDSADDADTDDGAELPESYYKADADEE